ncbi:MAG: hypothetical protein EBU08_03730 [Micrococcales bacterium]|nr:hypothetical protein [Micrococcales bacterium]
MKDKSAELWLLKNYDELMKLARLKFPKDPGALISHLTFYIDRDFTKIASIKTHDEQMRWCHQWMKNQIRWQRSNFNLDRMTGYIETTDDFTISSGGDFDSQKEIELGAESGELGKMSKIILDWQREWSDGQIQKIMKLKLGVSKLDEADQIFMNMYIECGLSLRDIAKKTRLPLSAVWSILQKIKEKIKKDIDDRINDI